MQYFQHFTRSHQGHIALIQTWRRAVSQSERANAPDERSSTTHAQSSPSSPRMTAAGHSNLKSANCKNMSRLKPDLHPLLTESVINTLFSKNIYTTLNFVESEIKLIALITNLTYKDILAIRKHLIHKNSAVVQNGLNYYNELLQKSAILLTGIETVDNMLQDGLITGNIYEVCGMPASGKTQFCLTLIKNVVLKLDQCVYYIDTKGDFSGTKIKAMLDAAKISEAQIGNIMSKMLVKQIGTKYELINSLYGIQNEICNGLKLRLIIIDSLPPLFYQSTDYGRNYGVMNQCVNVMHLLAREYHIAFVVTNTVTTWYEGDFGMGKLLTEKLGLGKYWSNIANTRLMIKQTNEPFQYEIGVVKSNILPKEKRCIVKIGDVGMF